MLLSFKSFSQNSTETVNPVQYGDSLVCFPQRYLQFMADDIRQGRKDKVKVEELRDEFRKKDEEFTSIKNKLNLERQDNSSLRDTLEMKNSLILNYHDRHRKDRTKLTIWQGLAMVCVILFAVK